MDGIGDMGQEWLSSIGIKYYEGKMNLNWKPILKSIMEVCLLPLSPATGLQCAALFPLYRMLILGRTGLVHERFCRECKLHLGLLCIGEWQRNRYRMLLKCCFCLQDPEQFIADGGWNFLDTEGDEEEGEEDEEEEDQEFAPESSEGVRFPCGFPLRHTCMQKLCFLWRALWYVIVMVSLAKQCVR